MPYCNKIHYINDMMYVLEFHGQSTANSRSPTRVLDFSGKVIFASFPHCCHMLVSFHISLSQVSLLLQLHGQPTTNSR